MKTFFLRLLVSMLTVAALAPIGVLGQTASGLSADAQAQMMTKLWLDTCAKHFTDSDALRNAAKSFQLQQDPPYASQMLAGKEGTVWDASIGSLGQFALVLLKDGTCKVTARRAASGPVVATFDKIIQDINTPGVTAQRVVDREVDQSGQKYRQIAYFVSRTGADNGWIFIATVSDSFSVDAQATISTSRSKKP